jgi:Asp-tRNA(Asn)/Glu-tRNA(Gln) amidotransferase A subunit family amidase
MAQGSAGLPLGIQVVGRYGDDLRLLQAAQAIGRNLS